MKSILAGRVSASYNISHDNVIKSTIYYFMTIMRLCPYHATLPDYNIPKAASTDAEVSVVQKVSDQNNINTDVLIIH